MNTFFEPRYWFWQDFQNDAEKNFYNAKKDGTEFIGGNYASALSLEAQFPNLLPEDTKTDISLFMDAANLWSVDYDSQLDSSNKIRSSVGVVANVFTIVGPLNFTLAKSITKAKTDVTQAFAFRLGTSF